jgi:uncharacterized protein
MWQPAPTVIVPSNRTRLNWRSLHAGLFLVLFLLALHLPAAERWPWHLLIPTLAYALLCGTLPPLRRTCVWLAVGRSDWGVFASTACIALLSTLSLVLYQYLIEPDVHSLATRLPGTLLGSTILAGACFSVVNAALEEILFRGVLYDGLDSQWGWRAAIIISGVFFGVLHIAGYPPGPLGAVMAGIYGILLGWLRRRTGGLLWPIVAHIVADATIFGILVHAEAL